MTAITTTATAEDEIITEHVQEHEQEQDHDIVLRFLQQKTRLFELLGDTVSLGVHATTREKIFHLIKGHVQSGKSRIIHSLCLYLACVLNHNVVVIVRNFTDDYDQFRRGFETFLLEFHNFLSAEQDIDLPNVYYIGDVKRTTDGNLNHHEDLVEDLASSVNVVIALANHDQISKLNDCIDYLDENTTQHKPLTVIVDEVDQIGYSLGDRLAPHLRHLMTTKSDHVFGISATLFEPLQTQRLGFTTNRVYHLVPPPEYKGVTHMMYHYIEPTQEDLLNDRDLDMFLNKEQNHEPFEIHDTQKHPLICLVKTEGLIAQQDVLMKNIVKKYPGSYTVITYNGTCCRLHSLRLKNDKITLPVCKKKGSRKDGVYVFKNTPLPYVLQYLKNNGGAEKFPRIIIIAYKLVGRGINIVSEDFRWHLTHMFYRPSPTTDATTLIQSMRLCGIYKDNIPLRCYIPKKDYENLYKAYMLQEELFSRILELTACRTLYSVIKEQTVYKEKVPKCALYKNTRFQGKTTTVKTEDVGWTMEKFYKERCVSKMTIKPEIEIQDTMSPNELNRLTNETNGMFKKWGNPVNQSAIARFMRDGLDPHKKYTKKEISELCKEYKITLSHLMKKYEPHGWAFGNIIILSQNKYFLHNQLIESFLKYF